MAEALTEEPDYNIFENKTGLAEDLKFLASMPELCDVTFLVGDTREPVCAVRAVLASRSRSVQGRVRLQEVGLESGQVTGGHFRVGSGHMRSV